MALRCNKLRPTPSRSTASTAILIFVARDDRRDIIVPDPAGVQAGWFPANTLREIRTAMEEQFRGENYDAGITGAVDALLGIYRSHLGGLRQPGSGSVAIPAQGRFPSGQGMHISMFWWIILIVVGFLIVRSLLRAASAPRYYGGGTPPARGAAGSGLWSGIRLWRLRGGGSFWSGLLGGLGGAWLGNELFRGGGGGGGIAPARSRRRMGDRRLRRLAERCRTSRHERRERRRLQRWWIRRERRRRLRWGRRRQRRRMVGVYATPSPVCLCCTLRCARTGPVGCPT